MNHALTLSMIVDAAAFAAEQHAAKQRLDEKATPYVNHPIKVARLLAVEVGIDDPVVLSAALLHDTIEVGTTSRAEIATRFGIEVADVVAEVTDPNGMRRVERQRLQIERARDLSPRARLVKVADKTANLRDLVAGPPPQWSPARRLAYFDHAAAVVDVIRAQSMPARLIELFEQAYAPRWDLARQIEQAGGATATVEPIVGPQAA